MKRLLRHLFGPKGSQNEDPVPPEARALHEQGRRLGSEGKCGEALEAFARASELCPGWAHPVYDSAYTHLLAGDRDKALELYEKTDSMVETSFFTLDIAL